MENSVLLRSTAGLLLASYLLHNAIRAWIARSRLSSIPAIGPSGILSSYVGAYKYFLNGREMIQEGYQKYPGTAFRVPMISKWMIIVSGPKMIDDIRKATDDQVSFREAVTEVVQADYTIGPEPQRDPYHIATIRTPLTRNLAICFDDVQDEITASFQDFVPATEEWIKIPASETCIKIVCRASNRLFVGLPLCRNPDYVNLNEQFTIDVMKGANIINVFPNILKPMAAYLFTNVQPSIQRAIDHLEPIIKDRLDKEEQYGAPDWPGKPNDLLSWLLDEAQGPQRSIREVTLRVLTVNFAAIHTTSMAFTQALYDLATYPSYVPELREEIESVIKDGGMDKMATRKMRKLDSFMKESHRLSGTGALAMGRKILKDFTFSDGTVVPAGNTIAIATFATHHDETTYSNPLQFDGFRFANMRDGEGEGIKHQMISISPDYLTFGVGRHACPGRFFAVNEIKAMLAYVLLTYDVKLENEGVRPPDKWIGPLSMPNPTASVMFRKRV